MNKREQTYANESERVDNRRNTTERKKEIHK